MKLQKKYLKGNTIIEVLIALAITAFCSGLAVIIYLNIQKSSLPFFKIKAVELAEFHIKETIQNKVFIDEVYKDEEFTVKKTIVPHQLFNDCYAIRIIVFDGNKKKLFELERTVYRDR